MAIKSHRVFVIRSIFRWNVSKNEQHVVTLPSDSFRAIRNVGDGKSASSVVPFPACFSEFYFSCFSVDSIRFAGCAVRVRYQGNLIEFNAAKKMYIYE